MHHNNDSRVEQVSISWSLYTIVILIAIACVLKCFA